MERAQWRRLAGRVRNRVRRARTPAADRGPGTPRDVADQQTHVGPWFDAIVTRTMRRMKPAGIDDDYDLAHRHFDVAHYLLQKRHQLFEEQADPLEAFLGEGADAQASPEINFSTQMYLARHPRRAQGPEASPYLQWLKRGRAAGEIADPAPGLVKLAPVLGLSAPELADTLASTRTDLQQRLMTGTLGEMFARAAEVEPLIGDVWPEATQPRIPPFVTPETVDQVAAMHACQQAAGFARARLVLVISAPRWGGGRRAEGHLAHALAARIAPEDIVVIYTDAGGRAPIDRFPAGVREIDFAGATHRMRRPAAQRALVELIRTFRADSVVVIGSRVFYDALTSFGRALASSERIFLMMFCSERIAMGNWVGLPVRYFYRHFDVVEGVLTDSHYLAGWLRDRHQLDAEGSGRIHALESPVDAGMPVAGSPPDDPGRRPQVFWAGRWDRQKRIDIALEVAHLMPDVDFRMWGESVLTREHQRTAPANVRLEGSYEHISKLDLSDADVWLYTSAWDGVPSQLLEVGMTGVPIVGTLVGGTGEVLGDEDSWPVHDIEDPAAYAAAIRDVLADPADSRRRARAMRERLLAERTEAAFRDRVAAILLAPTSDGEAR